MFLRGSKKRRSNRSVSSSVSNLNCLYSTLFNKKSTLNPSVSVLFVSTSVNVNLICAKTTTKNVQRRKQSKRNFVPPSPGYCFVAGLNLVEMSFLSSLFRGKTRIGCYFFIWFLACFMESLLFESWSWRLRWSQEWLINLYLRLGCGAILTRT